MKPLSTLLSIGAFALGALPLAASAVPAYVLANDGRTLVAFDTSAPGVVSNVGALSGAVVQLDGLDFRPADGRLYGYSSLTSGIYRVDPLTGATTLVSTSTAPVTASVLGIDFNPVPDRLRIATDQTDNRRINVDNGAAIVDGALAFMAGDPNAGATPRVADVAYTNSDTNPATGTQLYYIDYILDALLTTSNPNAGVLTTVGALGLDTNAFVGFDIFTDFNGLNTAYATLTSAGGPALYTINLMTGAATLIGAIPGSQINGLAVALVVPEPGSLALALAAGGAFWLSRRRARPAPAQR